LYDIIETQNTRLVVVVGLKYKVQVQIEERPVLCHEIERRLVEQHAVLDRCGPAQHGAPRRLGGMRMHDAAPPMCLGLPAGGSELVLGERRPAAFADALRAEDLDHVGPARDALLYGAA